MNKKELIYQIKRKKSFLCIGLDTDIKKIPTHLLKFEDPIFQFKLHYIIMTLIKEKKDNPDPNPWQATTLEWSCPSPPIGHGNFEDAPSVYRGPYEYSVPGAEEDFIPQNKELEESI